MKILLIADEPCKAYWDYYDGKCLDGIDLILSAGDLPSTYLSFLVTFANCPLLYVHGNHDGVYDQVPPDGCICIDDKIYVHEGVRILGLGGSMCYNHGPYQWTEKQMSRRAKKLWFQLKRRGGFDILLTHAPIRGFGDQDDLPHRGFETFGTLIETHHPRFMVHGHVHMNYGRDIPRTQTVGETTVINAYQKYLLDF
jgi:Icc-related predicted phosphoesterase